MYLNKRIVRHVLMTGLLVTLIALLAVGQLAAQDLAAKDLAAQDAVQGTRSTPELECTADTELNPDNDLPEALTDLTSDHVALMRHDGQDVEILVYNRSTGLTTQITDNTYADMYPQIDGQYIVWQFESPTTTSWDIALHNLTTGVTQVIGDSPRDDTDAFIEGDHVVWARNEAPSSVVHYNIATGVSDNIVSIPGLGHNYSVYGVSNGMALYHHRGPLGNTHVSIYDIQADKSTLVSEGVGEADQKYPSRFQGNVVVWTNENPGGAAESAEIYAYELETETLTRVTNNTVPDQYPLALGQYVTYRSTTAGGEQIHLYNLETGIASVIASSAGVDYGAPIISESRIGWNSSSGIYIYDIATGLSDKVSNYAGQDGMILDGNQIFWIETLSAYDVSAYTAKCGFAPQIGYQPQSIEIESGETAMLYVFVTGDETLEYQWYQGDATDSSIPVAGATTNTFVTPPLTQTTRYWVRISNPFGGIESVRADVIVEGSVAPPTPTPEGSVQLLTNTDFELDADGDKIPDGWTAKGATLDKSDKLKRNKVNDDGSVKTVAYTGEAAFMFRGNPDGQKSKLQYKVNDFSALTDAGRLEFSVFVDRYNVAPGTVIGKVKVMLSDGSKQTLQLTVPAAEGYAPVSDLWVVDLDGRLIEKLKIEFSTDLTGGKFMIDRASLLVIPGISITSSVGADETDLLPLP